MNSVKLKDVYFGSVDGLKEANRDNFINMFYRGDIDYYDKLVNKGCFIIQGRKGTGKTVLAHFVKDKLISDGSYCKIKNLDCFKEQRFSNLKNHNFENGEESLFWKWVILIDIGKIILENRKFWDFMNFKKRKLKKFINNLNPKDSFKIDSKTKEGTNSIKASRNGIGGEISEKIGLHYSKAYYLEMLDELENLVVNALDNNLFLIYDDLDEMQINLEFESHYQKLINGLLSIASDLNIKYVNNKFKLQTIIVIRDDIAAKIHSVSGNSNKKMSENTIHLNWFENRGSASWTNPLVKLILFRAKVSNEKFSQISDIDLYKKFFPEEVDKKNLTDAIFDKTHGRPRDFIAYINFAVSQNPELSFISKEMFLNASTEYSNWFYDELQNEMSIHKDHNFILDSLKLIESYKHKRFTFSNLEDYYNCNIANFESIQTFQECINFLYTFGVIGNIWEVKKTNKHGKIESTKLHHSWAYRPDGNNYPDCTKEFVVHQGLKKKFS